MLKLFGVLALLGTLMVFVGYCWWTPLLLVAPWVLVVGLLVYGHKTNKEQS